MSWDLGKPTHVVTEDYAHYEKRKHKEMITALKWVVPIIFIGMGYFAHSLEMNYKPTSSIFTAGMPFIIIGIVWLIVAAYLTFSKK